MEINTAKETYQKLLQSMQDLKAEEKTQQEKVQKLQKTLHERVAGAEEETPLDELDLHATMAEAGVHLTKEQQEALSKVFGKNLLGGFHFRTGGQPWQSRQGTQPGARGRSRSPKRMMSRSWPQGWPGSQDGKDWDQWPPVEGRCRPL